MLLVDLSLKGSLHWLRSYIFWLNALECIGIADPDGKSCNIISSIPSMCVHTYVHSIYIQSKFRGISLSSCGFVFSQRQMHCIFLPLRLKMLEGLQLRDRVCLWSIGFFRAPIGSSASSHWNGCSSTIASYMLH